MLKLFNTMGRKKEEFRPLYDNEVKLYTCGPTVYNYAHIGNLRTYVFEDILKRVLLLNGYKVIHVMNVTDIGHLESDADEGEDKIEKEAKKEGKSVLEIARFYENAFFNDLKKLNIIEPDVKARATEHVEDMIELIKKIEKNGYAYFQDGNLYFDVMKFKDYGKLANLKLENLKAGARIEVDKRKKSPYDFVLWFTKSKFKNHILNWESPWGEGFPGWHIECSAMSVKYLGEQFDIHCGGIDHIPVHHTNEIAQTEAATGKKWVNYWLHGEFLIMEDDEKMSKSKGNFITLQTLIDRGYEPVIYRFFLLQAHYRKKLIFSFKTLEGAKRGFYSFKERVITFKEEFEKMFDNNFNNNITDSLKSNNIILDGKTGFDKNIINKFYEYLRSTSSYEYYNILRSFIDKNIEENFSDNARKIKEIIAELIAISENIKFDEKFKNYVEQFMEYVNDDLNMPKALSLGLTLIRDNSIDNVLKFLLLIFFDYIYGFNILSFSRGKLSEEQIKLIKEREEARKNKDYKKADEIRELLNKEGIILQDTKEGTSWFVKN